jgi:hypothetical protein
MAGLIAKSFDSPATAFEFDSSTAQTFAKPT